MFVQLRGTQQEKHAFVSARKLIQRHFMKSVTMQ